MSIRWLVLGLLPLTLAACGRFLHVTVEDRAFSPGSDLSSFSMLSQSNTSDTVSGSREVRLGDDRVRHAPPANGAVGDEPQQDGLLLGRVLRRRPG